MRRRVRFGSIMAAGVLLLLVPLSAQASHSWGNYHWARTSNPFAIRVIDSMTSSWDDNLTTAISDWNQSQVLDVSREAGSDVSKDRKRCAPVAGKVRACNALYGRNNWLGLAQIWASGNHITQAIAKMNDTWLNGYSETNRQHVICQEIGHAWGLDHQDESGADLNTCMDYADALDNPHPNNHDYQQLETIYAHLDSTTTIAAGAAAAMPAGFANADVHAQANWGAKVAESADGRAAVFVRDFGGGNRVITHVFWAR